MAETAKRVQTTLTLERDLVVSTAGLQKRYLCSALTLKLSTSDSHHARTRPTKSSPEAAHCVSAILNTTGLRISKREGGEKAIQGSRTCLNNDIGSSFTASLPQLSATHNIHLPIPTLHPESTAQKLDMKKPKKTTEKSHLLNLGNGI